MFASLLHGVGCMSGWFQCCCSSCQTGLCGELAGDSAPSQLYLGTELAPTRICGAGPAVLVQQVMLQLEAVADRGYTRI